MSHTKAERWVLAVVLLIVTMFAMPTMASVILPTFLPNGATEYQIAFVTLASYTTLGSSGLESTYNAAAQTAAASDSVLNNLGVSWYAITATYELGGELRIHLCLN